MSAARHTVEARSCLAARVAMRQTVLLYFYRNIIKDIEKETKVPAYLNPNSRVSKPNLLTSVNGAALLSNFDRTTSKYRLCHLVS